MQTITIIINRTGEKLSETRIETNEKHDDSGFLQMLIDGFKKWEE